ncbi:MAG: hypothetical protein LBC47_06095, partial [Tannerella sp.]|nr:hypothetical protein [Tannerella sp.]
MALAVCFLHRLWREQCFYACFLLSGTVCALLIAGCKDKEIVIDEDSLPVKNANETVNPYTGYFRYGSNMGYVNGNWLDQDVADVLVGSQEKNLEGVGVNSLRPALPESFLEDWSYDIRTDAFEYYEHIGAVHNVVFIGDSPSDQHRDETVYSSGTPSESFKNLYEPVWDNGENGTPVNDNNFYALYVYKTVQEYGKNVKFWEIKNEPDFTYGVAETDGWWNRDPEPRLLENWHAPVQHYVRLLRVSYEVIKHVDPDAFVCVGGIGYASFLDAVLRNTDNPDGGKVTPEYPCGGGAWFDCLSF